MARNFGAPLMEPPGNAASNWSSAVLPGLNLPRTVLTRWCSVAKLSRANNWGTVIGVALVGTSSGALGVGDILYYAPLTSSRSILTGDPVQIPIGAFIATEA